MSENPAPAASETPTAPSLAEEALAYRPGGNGPVRASQRPGPPPAGTASVCLPESDSSSLVLTLTALDGPTARLSLTPEQAMRLGRELSLLASAVTRAERFGKPDVWPTREAD